MSRWIRAFRTFARKVLNKAAGAGTQSRLEFEGDYKSWSEASANAGAYSELNILEKCAQALLKVKNGEAVHERDSVLFDKIEYSWPLLSGLLRAALDNAGELHVLDFGGSLGSTYFQNRVFLRGIPVLWSIVEQEGFVSRGRELFQDQRLRFFYALEEAVKSDPKINVCVISSTLPYLPDPYSFIAQLLKFNFEYIIVDRTYFIDGEKDRLVVQHVPEFIYKAHYPAWFFSEKRLLEAFAPDYEVLADFDSYLNAAAYLANGNGKERGMIFQKKRPK